MGLGKRLLDELERTEPSEFEVERETDKQPDECDGINCPPRAHDHKVLL